MKYRKAAAFRSGLVFAMFQISVYRSVNMELL